VRPLPLPAHVRSDHELVAANLRARWAPDAPWAVAGVDLVVRSGRRTAVVGVSGAGKSTLADVLLRFLPYEGTVRLDGVDLDRLRGDDVRTVVGLVTQDAHVFDTTVAENVRLARRSATDEQVRAALAAARLLEWVDTLPRGLESAVGEHGARISGGQRQRLALARALLADRPLLVADEPTEHLDPETADALTADLLAATADRGVLLITHRLTGLERVDEIVVLDQGRVIERGTHEVLLRRGAGYAQAWLREQ